MAVMNRVYLSLGSNINKEKNLPAAVRLLRARARVMAVSDVFETVPIGTGVQPCFFNAAVLIETELAPKEIKDQLIDDVETALERERQADDRNAPRTIDIDITLFNDAVMDYVPADGRPRHIPDKDLLRSVHTIVPVANLAPDKLHPETGERLGTIAARLLAQLGDEQVIWLRENISLKE